MLFPDTTNTESHAAGTNDRNVVTPFWANTLADAPAFRRTLQSKYFLNSMNSGLSFSSRSMIKQWILTMRLGNLVLQNR